MSAPHCPVCGRKMAKNGKTDRGGRTRWEVHLVRRERDPED